MPNRTIGAAIVILVVMAWAYGCARQAADAPVQQPAARESAPSAPSPPSRGSGLKERMPVTVTTGDRLGWVDHALKTYPSDRFQTGLGIGPDRKTAQDRSLTELEKPFLHAITGRLKLQINALGEGAEGLDQAPFTLLDDYRRRVLNTVRLHARVAEVFLERKPAVTYYALAVLDRPACSGQLKPLVQRRDQELEEMVLRLDETAASISPADRKALMEAFVYREALDAAMSVVAPQTKGGNLSVRTTTIGRLIKK